MKKSILFGSSILISSLMSGPVFAQEAAPAADDGKRLDTVVITATKREQTLQEVPVAVSVVGTEVIESAQITDIIDLQSVVPSLRVSQLNTSANTSFVIRGFGNGSNGIGIEPSVAVFIDGVYRTRSSAAIADFPGLQRVEVLRGPQSTLFGKNASAGVISFVTKEPEFEWGGSLEGTLGNFNQRIVKGSITGPISDNVAFSLSGNFNERDGYADNLDGQDLNDRDRYAIRGQILAELSDELSVRVIADYDEIDEICCYSPIIAQGPLTDALFALGGNTPTEQPFNYVTALDVDPTNEISNGGLSVHVDYDLGWADFTSITSYREQERADDGDVDFTNAPALDSNAGDSKFETFTQEFRLAGSTEKLDWLVGAYYFNEDLVSNQSIVNGPIFRAYANILGDGIIDTLEAVFGEEPGTYYAQGNGAFETFTQENQSYSLFGQLDYHFTDRLTATVGLSYTDDEKTVTADATNLEPFYQIDLSASPFSDGIGAIVFAGAFQGATGLDPTPDNFALVAGADPDAFAAIQAGAAAATPGTIASLQGLQFLQNFIDFPNAVESGESNDDDVTYTARLAYDLTDTVNVYGSYATGFKASSWNLSRDSSPFAADFAALDAAGLAVPNSRTGTRFAGPESTEVFEIGLKAEFDNININLAVFDQSIEGFQSSIFQGSGFVLSNAGEQSTLGLEIETTYKPTDALTLSFAGTFLDPEYDDFTNAPGVGGTSVDLSGEQPAGIHEVSISAGARYDFTLSNGMLGFIQGDYQYQDEVPIVENVPAAIASREVNTFNAAAGLDFGNGLDVRAWIRNLNDDNYLTSAFPTTVQPGSFSGYPNAPRTYGMTVRKTF